MRAFLDKLIRDENDINEKAIIGIISFLIMVIYSAVDVGYAIMGKQVEINETIYSSFETIVLGAFLISSGEKIARIATNKRRNARRQETKDGQ